MIGAGMVGKTHLAALADLKDRVRLHSIVTRSTLEVHRLIDAITRSAESGKAVTL
jgi:predicted dehydrogenase